MLTGKTVLVLGVGNGLGNEVVQRAIEDGARVVIAARTEEILQRTASDLDPSGDRIAYAVTDVSDLKQCEAAVDLAMTRFGSLDAVVLVAAYEASFGGLHETDLETWRKAWETNVLGAATLIRAASKPMASTGGGAIVLIGSQSMLKPSLPQAGYASSKGGLLSLMYYLAEELGADNIRVNMVVPSWMWGPTVQGLVGHRAKSEKKSEAEIIAGIAGKFPLRRMAEDKDVADAVVFLASNRARAITGQSLMVNCGEIMR